MSVEILPGTNVPVQVLIALISSISVVVSALATYFFGVLKARRDLELQYDKNLRDKRLDAYKELWKLFQPMAKYSPPRTVTYWTINELSVNLRIWYFEVGGIFLSSNSRDKYFAVQDEIRAALGRSQPQQYNEVLPHKYWQAIFSKSSELRTSLAMDLGSRAKAMFGGAR
jgi:hypothetical protein